MRIFLKSTILIAYSTLSFAQGIPPNNFETSPYSGGTLKAVTPVVIDGVTSYIYEHSASSGATYTQGTGIQINGSNVISNTGDLSNTNELEYWAPYIVGSDTIGTIRLHPGNSLLNDTFAIIGINNSGGGADGSETKINSGANINVTGAGTVAIPYVITGLNPEATTVTDSPTIDFTKTGNDITGVVRNNSVTPAMLTQTYLTTEAQTITLDSTIVAGVSKTYRVGVSGTALTRNILVPLTSGGGSSDIVSILGSDFVTSSNVTAATSITVTLPTIGKYVLNFLGSYTTVATTTGMQIRYSTTGVNTTSGITIGHWRAGIAASAVATELVLPDPIAGSTLITTGAAAANNANHIMGEHCVTTTAANATVTVFFASEVSASAATLKMGSSLIAKKIQ